MKPTLELLASMHERLANDYKTADGYPEYCVSVATEIGMSLVREGRLPSIAVVKDHEIIDRELKTKPLVPLMYEGRVAWDKHLVICCNGQVFDPILDEPVPIEDYTRRVFGEDIPLHVTPPGLIEEVIRVNHSDE